MGLHIIILAAGQGTRMCSDKPKVLHTVANNPILSHVLATAAALTPDHMYVVYGDHGEQLQQAFVDYPTPITWVHQTQQLGTGDAVKQVLPLLNADDRALILLGDMPLIATACLQTLLTTLTTPTDIGVLTACVTDPTGLGRIIRDCQCHHVQAIIEDKDIANTRINKLTPADIYAIHEINTGVFALSVALLQRYLPKLNSDNVQDEYYLTDIIALAHQDNHTIYPVVCEHEWQALGVNTRAQLANVERHYQRVQAEALMQQGATLIDPSRIDIRGTVRVGRNVVIDVNTVFEGDVSLGDNCYIAPNTIIRHSQLADNVNVYANSVIDGATIAAHSTIGPFARIRPGTQLAEHVHIGNFVELKNVTIGEHSKAGHLSYLGDANVGAYTNIGAGTITCNYDGVNKFETTIGDHVFIGSNTLLRAPVSIGDHATTGAGAVIRRNVGSNQLSITWQEQQIRDDWQRGK